MKKLILPLTLAAALCAHGQDLTRVEIKTKEDIEALAAIPEWKRGADTNGITISVFVGAAERNGEGFLLTRRLTFDAEGRLVRASPISTTPGLGCVSGGFASFDEMRKFYFPTDDERTKKRKAQIEERVRIQEELRAQREAREITQRERSQRTPAQPTAPRPSAIPPADER